MPVQRELDEAEGRLLALEESSSEPNGTGPRLDSRNGPGSEPGGEGLRDGEFGSRRSVISSGRPPRPEHEIHEEASTSGSTVPKSGLVSLNGSSPSMAGRAASPAEHEAAGPFSSPTDSHRQRDPRRRGELRSCHSGSGIMDTIGREIAVIVAPVSICMLLVVCLVLTLTPNGSQDGAIVPVVGALVYQEKSTDSEMEKLEGGLLNAAAFVGLVAVLTFILVGLFWLRCTKCLWGYMGFSGFTILACLGGYVAVQLIKVLSIPIDLVSFLVLLYNVSVVGVLAVFFCRMPIFLTQCYLVLIAAVVAFWFTHLPEWTTWLILVAMAIYDLVAVLAPGGPLKLLLEIAMERDEDLPALVYEARPPPHAPLTPPPEPSTSPPAVLVAGDRAGPFRRLPNSAFRPASSQPHLAGLLAQGQPGSSGSNANLLQQPQPQWRRHPILARSASDSDLAAISTDMPQLPFPAPAAAARAAAPSAAAVAGVPGTEPNASGASPANVDADVENPTAPVDKHGSKSTEPRRLVGRFEKRAAAAAAAAQDLGSLSASSTPPRAHNSSPHSTLLSVVSESSVLGSRESSTSAERYLAGRRTWLEQNPGLSGSPILDPAAISRGLSERSRSLPESSTRGGEQSDAEFAGRGRKPQLFLERLEVPIDEEGTAVVVQRQRSPVRRHNAKKPGGFVPEARVRPSQQQQQGVPGAGPQPFHLFQDLPPHQPPGPVRFLSTEVPEGRTGRDMPEEVAGEFVLPSAIKLGLGDFIFYSIMVGRAAMYDMMTVYACYLAVIAGLGATLVLLAVTRRALPALPFSICLGVIFYLLTRVLMEPFVIVLMTSLLYF